MMMSIFLWKNLRNVEFKDNLFSPKSESIETGKKMRAAEQYVGQLDKVRKFRFIQIEEDLKLLNYIATNNKCKKRKKILMYEITIKDSIIEELQHQLSLHKSNITVIGIEG